MDQTQGITPRLIFRNWKLISLIVALFAAVTFFVSTIIPPRYQSETQILILQKNMEIDAYRATKASEFAGEILKRVISSTEFMNGVLQRAGENANKYGTSQEDQIDEWNKSVKVDTVVNTGVVKITVLDKSKKEDRNLTEALVTELLENGIKYHGNDNITLKKISGPVYFDSPAYPIIWLNTLVAALVGIFFSIGLIFLFGDRLRITLFGE